MLGLLMGAALPVIYLASLNPSSAFVTMAAIAKISAAAT